MRDLEEEKQIKAYMKAKMTHIKMYNECMNLADGLDVEKFDKLVRADERDAMMQTINELMGSERDRNPMFSEGYDHALRHLYQFVGARSKEKNE
jgi:hypothetical protein